MEWRGPSRTLGIAAAVLLFVAVGSVGAFRYADSFWLYRGFPPPSLPKSVRVNRGGVTSTVGVQAGIVQTIFVPSPAIGGRRQVTYVYLPPGYSTDTARRYPVFYLLHGHPGGPVNFLLAGQMGVQESVLIAAGRIAPVILVMPFGSTGFLGADEEWANGVRPGNQWETFVARDLVNFIDSRYRTIATARGRAIGGLSEGGYGSLNIGLHHPDEFGFIESWSGYERAFPIPAIFDQNAQLLAYNSPMESVILYAPALRAAHTFIWFYVANGERFLRQNEQFDALLSSLGINHRFFVPAGGHSWTLWRAEVPNSLTAASDHLSRAEG